MQVYRLSKEKFSNDLTGQGARNYGGRWNSKGYPIIYTSESRSLAAFELAVHLNLSQLPYNYAMVTINLPDGIKIESIDRKKLPANWNSFPFHTSTRKIGDDFIIRNENLVLKVPSAIIQGDFNFLINPLHKDISKTKIVHTEPFNYDHRLLS
ncbi:MAG: RES family NAD+ phosphorylase [Ignavibacteria bacterium]|nr:RES family NAD+ phosphorylase [Ignavibacteria bacterium]